MGNPVRLVDPDGRAISVKKTQENDEKEDAMKKTLLDLKKITGLALYIDENGEIDYYKNSDGGPIINGMKTSITARQGLMKAIDDKEKTAVFDFGTESKSEGLNFSVSIMEVEKFIKGTSSDLNPMTLGYGMVFFHELLHTDLLLGVGHEDSLDEFGNYIWGKPGRVVDVMNTIRSQLGADYGQRLSYYGMTIRGVNYLPFDKGNSILLKHQFGFGAVGRRPQIVPVNGKYVFYK